MRRFIHLVLWGGFSTHTQWPPNRHLEKYLHYHLFLCNSHSEIRECSYVGKTVPGDRENLLCLWGRGSLIQSLTPDRSEARYKVTFHLNLLPPQTTHTFFPNVKISSNSIKLAVNNRSQHVSLCGLQK